MNIRISEAARLYEIPYPATPVKAEETARAGSIERDSYIPSREDGECVCSTGNYDSVGEMDDDFSLDLGPGNEDTTQIAQYSMDYTRQLMKTVAAAEASSGGTHR